MADLKVGHYISAPVELGSDSIGCDRVHLKVDATRTFRGGSRIEGVSFSEHTGTNVFTLNVYTNDG